MKAATVFGTLASAAAFLVPGLALWVPSGYSYGAALLLLTAVLGAPWWRRECRVSVRSRWLLASIVAMGSIWAMDSAESAWRWGTLDRPSKYLLALPCVLFLLAHAPRPRWLWSGIAVGAVGSGVVAWAQVSWLGMPRAAGFTNAIQYGNLSVLLSLMCLVLLAIRPPELRRWHYGVLPLGVAAGLVASILSHSRGGWLAWALALPVLAGVLCQFVPWRRLLAGLLVLLCMVAALVYVQRHLLEERIDTARSEVLRYENVGDAETSVGQRLAHWELAWRMGLEKPLLGWGKTGYDVEKLRRVQAGQAHPFVLQFGHVHNEVLDVFAKHGLLGVLALCLFYGVPFWLFWPGRRHVMVWAKAPDGSRQPVLDRTALALRAVGWTIPLAYLGFGFSQVFFAHNSGNLFYLFMVMLIHSCLQARERDQALD